MAEFLIFFLQCIEVVPDMTEERVAKIMETPTRDAAAACKVPDLTSGFLSFVAIFPGLSRCSKPSCCLKVMSLVRI